MKGRGIAAGKRGLPEVTDALETSLDAADEELAAPDAPVVSISGSVESDAEHALVERASLGEDTGYVRAVVLNGDGRIAGHRVDPP